MKYQAVLVVTVAVRMQTQPTSRMSPPFLLPTYNSASPTFWHSLTIVCWVWQCIGQNQDLPLKLQVEIATLQEQIVSLGHSIYRLQLDFY